MRSRARVIFTKKSSNRKVGPIPVVTSERKTCSTSCPLRGNGCYAEYGPMRLKWNALQGNGNPNIKTKTWNQACKLIEELPDGQFWRYNDAGDLPGTNHVINKEDLFKLVKANKGKLGFTYTHKPIGVKGQKIFEENKKKHGFSYKTARDNLNIVKKANKEGLTINLSADSLAEADELYDLNIGPVAVTCPSDAPKQHKTPKGRHVIVCPQQYADVSCEQCKLCAKQRKAIIGFLAHGTGVKKVNNRLNVIQ